MAQTQVTQFNLYVDGTFHGGIPDAHRVYDLGSSSIYSNPELAFEELYGAVDLEEIAQMDVVAVDFMTVTSARIEVSTTVTHDVLSKLPELV